MFFLSHSYSSASICMFCMDSMEYSLSKFENDIANQFGHNVFYNNVLIRVFLLFVEKTY